MSMTNWFVNRRMLRRLVRSQIVENGPRVLVDTTVAGTGASYNETGGGACSETPGSYTPDRDVYVYEITYAVNPFSIDGVFTGKISRRYYEEGILVPKGKTLEVYVRYCLESVSTIDTFWGT